MKLERNFMYSFLNAFFAILHYFLMNLGSRVSELTDCTLNVRDWIQSTDMSLLFTAASIPAMELSVELTC
jgi:hypothetical protein